MQQNESIRKEGNILVANTNTNSRAPVQYLEGVLPFEKLDYTHWIEINNTIVRIETDSPYLAEILPRSFNFPPGFHFETDEYQLVVKISSDNPHGMYIDQRGNIEIDGTSWFGNVKNALSGILLYDAFLRDEETMLLHALINGPTAVIGATGTGKSSVGNILHKHIGQAPFSEDLTFIYPSKGLKEGINLETGQWYPRLRTLIEGQKYEDIRDVPGLAGLENVKLLGTSFPKEIDFASRALIDPYQIYGQLPEYQKTKSLIILSWGIPDTLREYWYDNNILTCIKPEFVSGYLREYQAPILKDGMAVNGSFVPSPFELPVMINRHSEFLDYISLGWDRLAKTTEGALLINTHAILYNESGLRRGPDSKKEILQFMAEQILEYRIKSIDRVDTW